MYLGLFSCCYCRFPLERASLRKLVEKVSETVAGNDSRKGRVQSGVLSRLPLIATVYFCQERFKFIVNAGVFTQGFVLVEELSRWSKPLWQLRN